MKSSHFVNNIKWNILNISFYFLSVDIALDILRKKPELAKEREGDYGITALHMLARKPYAIGSSKELSFWKRRINSRNYT